VTGSDESGSKKRHRNLEGGAPAAYDLLRTAHDNRKTFPADFPGLTAEIVYNENGRESVFPRDASSGKA
jgi:hypothetical protein